MRKSRSGLSATVRFEVLKRDRFTCQYCGRKAPDVLLQIDHIQPVAGGGTNDILNLITSCEACNGGKGAVPLSDESALAKQREQLETLQERKEQLELMAAWQAGLIDLEEQAVEVVVEQFARLLPGWQLDTIARASVRRLLAQHGLERVLSEMRLSASKYARFAEEKATEESSGIVLRTWLAALKYAALRERDPVEADLRYIRGILRNRLSYCPMGKALELLRAAQAAGVPVHELRERALETLSYTSFEYDVERRVEELGQ